MKRAFKQGWLERAIETQKFHATRVKEDDDWTIPHTARALHRSIGSICEDIMIVEWLKTHEDKIKNFKYAYQAIDFIREKKKSLIRAYE